MRDAHLFAMHGQEGGMLTGHTGLLIDKEAGNMQAQSLAQLIDKGVTRGASVHPPGLVLVVDMLRRGLHRHGARGRRCGRRYLAPRRPHTASSTQVILPNQC